MYRHRNKLEIESRINKARSFFFLLALLACCGMCVSEHLFMLPFAKHSPPNFFKSKSNKFQFSRSLHTTNDTFSGRNDFSSFFLLQWSVRRDFSCSLLFRFWLLATRRTNENWLESQGKFPYFPFPTREWKILRPTLVLVCEVFSFSFFWQMLSSESRAECEGDDDVTRREFVSLSYNHLVRGHTNTTVRNNFPLSRLVALSQFLFFFPDRRHHVRW